MQIIWEGLGFLCFIFPLTSFLCVHVLHMWVCMFGKEMRITSVFLLKLCPPFIFRQSLRSRTG